MQKIISLIIALFTFVSSGGAIELGGRELTRAQYAQSIYTAVSEETLPVINEIADNGIYDVTERDSYYNAVYALYRAGVLEGSDIYGGFHPSDLITEEQAEDIVQRLRNPSLRARFKMPLKIPAPVIYAECSDAVISIEAFTENGYSIRTGTAFFISGDGTALTLPHVIEGAERVEATFADGTKADMSTLDPIDKDGKIAVMHFPVKSETFLKLGDSELVREGDDIYVISNPLEYNKSMTSGIIAKAERSAGDNVFIQFSAPISFGSGGGPLLNALGQVVGIASSSYQAGQNLNLAVPINLLDT